ncbi:DUF4230 domain-containing protein [Clostridium sp. KNHs214]|uniref:DUF4230 domain-containing protein n=1 Tax=Clostridium sp. KNHs214 TaxID=1540257 RepID=UPI000556EA3A|nr:DUF4230 domain-containing protein [Clostridium sp. KNHs214]
MKKKNRFKTKLIILAILISTILGIYLGYRIFKKPSKGNKTWILPKINSSKKILTEEAIIKSMRDKSELITLETSLQQKIVIDDSWGSFSLFKKVQNINFFGDGVYCVDLSKISNDDIKVDNKKREITIKTSKPYVKNITIDETKTEYETVEKGILRFGEIKLDPSEYGVMMNEAKLRMVNEIKKSETFNRAEENSKNAITNFLQGILKKQSFESYNVKVDFK